MMVRVNSNGYVEVVKHNGFNRYECVRNWFLVKVNKNQKTDYGYVYLGVISVHPKFLGKRVRFRIEEVVE